MSKSINDTRLDWDFNPISRVTLGHLTDSFHDIRSSCAYLCLLTLCLFNI